MREFPASHEPKETDDLWCPQCQKYVRGIVVDLNWRARCKECRYSRRFGAAELTAKTKATKHALDNMHAVVVTRGDEIIEEITPKVTTRRGGQSDLFSGIDEPPF